MRLRLPWVSRRYAELLEQVLEQTRRERDEQTQRADRAVDNLFLSAGQAPVSSGVRADIAKDREAEAEYVATLNIEDESSGMLDDEWIEGIAQSIAETGRTN